MILVQTRQGGAVGRGRGRWPRAPAPPPRSHQLGGEPRGAGLSPKRGGGVAGGGAAEPGQQGDPQREYPGTLGRAGLGVGRRLRRAKARGQGRDIRDWDYLQNRGMLGQLGTEVGGAWAWRPAGGGSNSLALRVGEFLPLRLAQVTFDPMQPPYDSVQIYGLEGEGSRAGSLSSLESEGEKEAEKEDWGGGLEEWGAPVPRARRALPGEGEREGGERGEKNGEYKIEEDEREKEEGKKEEEKKADEVVNESNSENK
ncbi:hypothetical protein SKAU_G00377620 [Synaphobranchus kaupii]|uniref:Cadherin Y-type LIR-motif domain-containing protein n=1 Tax=Synaphobranchus kaupii TaxID=118154 RepID=A0A9Q1IEB6_SYNKA|nr:hypothetical protein SKAU_G00377620 [Synaphobranchus kaupii]